jgi:KDO2-lipid IV(A) lauroyltransferase
MSGVRPLLACLKLSNRLPYRIQMAMGSVAGRIIFHYATKRRAVAEKNIELCYPDLEVSERRRLLHAHFDSLGLALFETGLAYWGSDDKLRPMLKIDGLQNLESALSRGTGAILVAAHFTSMELCGRLLGLEVDYDAVFRPFSNPDVDAVAREGRQRAVRDAVPKSNFRRFLKSLRENRAVLITVDQATTASSKIMAPFFGIPAATSVNAARIAGKTGAAVLPLTWIRETGFSTYRVAIENELKDFPTGDAMTDATRINALVEAQVRKAPEQYYWIHRRFKTKRSPYDANAD